jgi:hypothetical protein
VSWLPHLTIFLILPAVLALCIKVYDRTRGTL